MINRDQTIRHFPSVANIRIRSASSLSSSEVPVELSGVAALRGTDRRTTGGDRSSVDVRRTDGGGLETGPPLATDEAASEARRFTDPGRDHLLRCPGGIGGTGGGPESVDERRPADEARETVLPFPPGETGETVYGPDALLPPDPDRIRPPSRTAPPPLPVLLCPPRPSVGTGLAGGPPSSDCRLTRLTDGFVDGGPAPPGSTGEIVYVSDTLRPPATRPLPCEDPYPESPATGIGRRSIWNTGDGTRVPSISTGDGVRAGSSAAFGSISLSPWSSAVSPSGSGSGLSSWGPARFRRLIRTRAAVISPRRIKTIGIPRPRAILVPDDMPDEDVEAVLDVGVGVEVAVGPPAPVEGAVDPAPVAPANTARSELCHRTSIPYPSAIVVPFAGTVTIPSLCHPGRLVFGV